jgi:hypothetical protein
MVVAFACGELAFRAGEAIVAVGDGGEEPWRTRRAAARADVFPGLAAGWAAFPDALAARALAARALAPLVPPLPALPFAGDGLGEAGRADPEQRTERLAS